MAHREHFLAIIDSTASDETALTLAAEQVARGDQATVVVLLTKEVRNDFRRFAEAEDLDGPTGEAMASDRLIEFYNTLVGGDDTATLLASSISSSDLLRTAEAVHATTIVVPQHLAAQHNLRRLVSAARVPVLVTPAA